MKISAFRLIIKKLDRLLTQRHKLYVFVLLFLAVLLSIIESIAISIIMPFISIATNPSLLDYGIYNKVFIFFGSPQKNIFIIVMGLTIICFNIFRAVYNICYTYISNKFSFGVFRHITAHLFKTYISIPYKVYVQRNSSELNRSIAAESHQVSVLLLNILQMSGEVCTVLILYVLMVVVDWKKTLMLTIGLGGIVAVVLNIVVRQSRRQGIKRVEAYKDLYKILAEVFGNFKFIRLKGKTEAVFSDFSGVTRKIAHSHVINSTLGIMPRSILESTGFSLIIGTIIFILWRQQSAEQVIPIVSMYALSLYRILPGVTRMLGNLNAIAYNQHSLDVVYKGIHQETEIEGNDVVVFEKSIRIEKCSFKYLVGEMVLHNVSLELQKGEKVAVTGESGSGKSTLIDILIGINKPLEGTLFIDNIAVTDANIRSWRNKIGYIPQNIYLFDGTVGANVAFGSIEEKDRIIQVLKMANIWDFLWGKEGIDTYVGEGGVQLSGGQKQRIGIARALYDNPDVLVLDEATSALDNETETKIMDEIYDISAEKTLIVIAHRLSTVERCGRQIRMREGRIVYQ
jgi:ATP-binding cassette subfamily B protein/ATP-binding cassette subfamily C protein